MVDSKTIALTIIFALTIFISGLSGYILGRIDGKYKYGKRS